MTSSIPSANAERATNKRADRPRLTTVVRLAAAGGHADRLRISLTAIGATAATVVLLIGVAVASIRPDDGPYRLEVLDQPGLRPGVIISMLLLGVPLIVLVGMCSRVGAPARDRRLAMFRMAGATPRDVVKIAATETGLAAAVGAAIGAFVFRAVLPLFDSTTPGFTTVCTVTPTATGTQTECREVPGLLHLLPTDVSIPAWVVLLTVATIGVAAAVSSAVTLRKAIIGPFGVMRSTPTKPPTMVPSVLFVGGTIALVVWGAIIRSGQSSLGVSAVVALALFVCCVVGLFMGSASIAAALGRLIAPRTRRPALLIAARRMIAAPYTASRASGAVVLAVLLGAAVQGVRTNFLLTTDPDDTFYADTFTLLNIVVIVAITLSAASLLVVTAEALVERRRTLSALAAAGTPRSVLGRAVLIESLLPVLPMILLATASGVLAARGLTGAQVEPYDPTSDGAESVRTLVDVPIPWERLVILGLGAMIVSALLTAASLVFMTRSTTSAELRAAA